MKSSPPEELDDREKELLKEIREQERDDDNPHYGH